MKQAKLSELNFTSRNEAIAFLKRLWTEEGDNCPICGNKLEFLHTKAKKSNCDWQCKNYNKVFKTIHLLDEVNEEYK